MGVSNLGNPEQAPSERARLIEQAKELVDSFCQTTDTDDSPESVGGFYEALARHEVTMSRSDLAASARVARAAMAGELIWKCRYDQAAALVANVGDPEAIFDVIHYRLNIFKNDNPEYEMDLARLEAEVLNILDATRPEVSIGFLRYRCGQMIDSSDAYMHGDMKKLFLQLAERLGVDYDPVAEWLETEALRFPFANWQAIAAIVRDDNSWPQDVNLITRLVDAINIGTEIHLITTAPSASFSEADKVRLAHNIATRKRQQIEEFQSPGMSYLHAMMAVAFYKNGNIKHGRLLVNEAVALPAAVSYVGQEILKAGPPMVSEARKIAEGLDDGESLISLLIDGAWPDKTWPNKFLQELLTMRTGRVGGNKGPIPSLHAIDLRLQCMLEMAKRYEANGDIAQSIEMQKRAQLLERQREMGIVKHMPKTK